MIGGTSSIHSHRVEGPPTGTQFPALVNTSFGRRASQRVTTGALVALVDAILKRATDPEGEIVRVIGTEAVEATTLGEIASLSLKVLRTLAVDAIMFGVIEIRSVGSDASEVVEMVAGATVSLRAGAFARETEEIVVGASVRLIPATDGTLAVVAMAFGATVRLSLEIEGTLAVDAMELRAIC